jgi:eukaryotic-like serine/threonine-protein kinase
LSEPWRRRKGAALKTRPINPCANNNDVPESFVCALKDSQLLSADQLENVWRWLPGTDMPTLSSLLVETGLLTPYQLQRLVGGQGAGLILGQYRILDELGEGGFGKVFKAVHSLMNRLAAVKLSTRKGVPERTRELFIHEVVATTRLTHPNIALVYEANESDDSLWFAMEYVDGPNLDQLVAQQKPLPISFVCAVMHQVAQALQYAHENGMVHRDIKPANLLLPGAATGPEAPCFPATAAPVLVKVVDFGLARIYPREARPAFTICRDGGCLGTPEFMSPEQGRNSHRVDIRSDLYSLGCTFYFALTGRLPFVGSTPLEIVTQHQEAEPIPLVDVRPEVPPVVAAIVRRLMAKKPEGRYRTPAELVEALSFTMRYPYPEACSLQSCSPLSLPGSPSERRKDLVAPTIHLASENDLDTGTAADRTQEMAPSEPAVAAPLPAVAARPKEQVVALWREWLAVVETFVRGTSSTNNEAEYKVLHGALMEELRARADSPLETQAPLYARLATLVEPWLRLRTIADLDRKTLLGLGETCRQLDAELPASETGFSGWSLVASLLAGVAVAGVSLVLFLMQRR